MSESLNPSRRLRYVYLRQGGKIEEGVLAKSLIKRIESGELCGYDEISGDGLHWARLDEHPQLAPFLRASGWESDYPQPLSAEPEEIRSEDEDWFQRAFSSPHHDVGPSHDLDSQPDSASRRDDGESNLNPFGFYSEDRFGGSGFPESDRTEANGLSDPASKAEANTAPVENPIARAFTKNEHAGQEETGAKSSKENSPVAPDAARPVNRMPGQTGERGPRVAEAGASENGPWGSGWIAFAALFLVLAGLVKWFFPAAGIWVEPFTAALLSALALSWLYRWEKRQQTMLLALNRLDGEFPHLAGGAFCESVSNKTMQEALRLSLSLHYVKSKAKSKKSRKSTASR